MKTRNYSSDTHASNPPPNPRLHDEDFTVDLQAKSLYLLKTLAGKTKSWPTFLEQPHIKMMPDTLYFRGKIVLMAVLQR